MKQPFKVNDTAPLTLARRFIAKFGFGEISVEKFDCYLIDNRMVKDPETDDPKDLRYKAFREERSQWRGRLNKWGPDCDEGERFHIQVVKAGQLYRVIPYAVSVLDEAADFAPALTRAVGNRTKRLHGIEKKLNTMMLLNGDDVEELKQVQRSIGVCVDQGDKVEKEMKAKMHQYATITDQVLELAEELMLRHMPEEGDEVG